MFSADFYQSAPVMALCASLGAVPLIGLSRRHPNLREFWTFAAAGLKFLWCCCWPAGSWQVMWWR